MGATLAKIPFREALLPRGQHFAGSAPCCRGSRYVAQAYPIFQTCPFPFPLTQNAPPHMCTLRVKLAHPSRTFLCISSRRRGLLPLRPSASPGPVVCIVKTVAQVSSWIICDIAHLHWLWFQPRPVTDSAASRSRRWEGPNRTRSSSPSTCATTASSYSTGPSCAAGTPVTASGG